MPTAASFRIQAPYVDVDSGHASNPLVFVDPHPIVVRFLITLLTFGHVIIAKEFEHASRSSSLINTACYHTRGAACLLLTVSPSYNVSFLPCTLRSS